MTSLKKGLIALSLSLAALSGTALAASEGKCSASYGTSEVQGEGEVKVSPDRATLNYRVSSIKDSPEEARVEVEKTVTAFADAVATLKLGENAFIADNITIMPRYEYNQEAKKTELKGYEAAREVNINIKDFSLIGKLNDMAIKAGINQIAGFQYSVEDRRKYEMEAARKAIADAKERAQLLADGFDVKLGQPCRLNFNSHGAIVYRNAAPRIMAMAAADSANSVQSTYTAEPMVVSASVSAVFSIDAGKDKKDKKDKED